MASILALLLPPLLDWLYGKVMGWAKVLIAERQARSERERQNQAVQEQTEKAETPKEREDAADAARDRFGA